MSHQYEERLKELKRSNLLRTLSQPPTETTINISSNDYLGLGQHASLQKEFMTYATQQGFKLGASSSRLLTGNHPFYTKLEEKIASSFNKEACLIYNSGYHINIGVLPALANKHDLIVADKRVHASIIDGLRLSKATVQRFAHNNYIHLEQLLEDAGDAYKQIFIVTESIFSMSGSMANLSQLVRIKKTYNAILYVDEAHAVGVRGATGLGCAEESHVIEEVDIIVGTFGKALASVGAYIVCTDLIKEYLINHSRSLIFTTALPPINIAWTDFVWDVMRGMSAERAYLHRIATELAEHLQVNGSTHILPYIVGENKQAVALSHYLKSKGVLALPIRHPTVPKGEAQIRISLVANLTEEQLSYLVNTIKHYEE